MVVLLVLLTLPLRANLGDSVEQCVKRYGKPVVYGEASAKSPFGTLVFVAGGYGLIVFLLNNTEVGARVSKADKTAFSDAELKTIMGADASTPWISTTSPDPACQSWTREDKATALYDREKFVLIFTSPAMAEALHMEPSKAATPAAPAAPAPPSGNFAPAPPATWVAPATNAATPVTPAGPN